jgi:hypothetical protein
MKENDQAEDEQKGDDIAGHPAPESVDMRKQKRPHDAV